MIHDLEVILAAHGAGEGSPANALVQACARALASIAAGARVREAFVAGSPSWDDVFRRVEGRRCVVIPMLTSDGFFAERLRAHVARLGNGATTSRPLGTHPVLVRALAERVATAVGELRPRVPRPHVLVVGHGTARHADSGTATCEAAHVIARRVGCTTDVAFLDQEPTVEELLARAPAVGGVVVVPFLLGGGAHAALDVPARVAAAWPGAPTRSIVVLEPLGGLPVLIPVLRSLAQEAGAVDGVAA